MAKRPERPPTRAAEFEPPEAAVPLRTRGAWLFYALVAIAAVVSVLAFRDKAIWPAQQPVFTMVALAAAVAVANMFGTFQTVEGLSEYTSLAMPIGFAMFLLLDWRYFVAAIALGELFTFVSELLRRANPTMWYIRVFNVFALIVCGAGSLVVLRTFHPPTDIGAHGAFDVSVAFAYVLASVAWKALDSAQVSTLIGLAAGRPFANLRLSSKVFVAQFSLFLIAIPLARLWYENVWLSTFALAPLAVAYRLLRLPELEHRLRTDERTGLTNAVAFDRALEIALDDARERGVGAALLAIDLDHFKVVNDTHGHLAGDAVIAQFADLLASEKRPDDIAARTGGEEFAIFVRAGDREAAFAFAERLRARVENETFRLDDVDIKVTTSIGVAMFPSDARATRDLRKAADSALYAAKRGGRNAVAAPPRAVEPIRLTIEAPGKS